MKFSTLAEHQIRKAEAEGQLDELKGAGQPLDLSGDGSADAIGFRIMAENGAVPREVALRKAVEAQTKRFRDAPDDATRAAERRKLAELQLRLDIEAEAIAKALSLYRGRMSETARRLGIGRSTLYRKIDKYELRKGDER